MKAEVKLGQTLLQKVFDYIPDADKALILERKKNSMNQARTQVRIQCYLDKDLYAALSYFGALKPSESYFFTALATDYITRRAVDIGLLNVRQNGGH